jgi:hypothetical protein
MLSTDITREIAAFLSRVFSKPKPNKLYLDAISLSDEAFNLVLQGKTEEVRNALEKIKYGNWSRAPGQTTEAENRSR